MNTRGLIQAARDLAIEGCLNDPTDDDIVLYCFETAGDYDTDLTQMEPALRQRIINVYDKWADPRNRPEILTTSQMILAEICEVLNGVLVVETARDRFANDDKLRNELAEILACKTQLEKVRSGNA